MSSGPVDAGLATLRELAARVEHTLAELDDLSLTTLPLLRRDETVIAFGIIGLLALGALLMRYVMRHRPGRTDIVLPALLPRMLTRRSALAPLRHTAFVLFLAGLPFFAVALGDPHTTLIQERSTFPGHRIAIHIASSNSPRFDVNPNTDEAPGKSEIPPRVARNTIYHDAQRPSVLIVPDSHVSTNPTQNDRNCSHKTGRARKKTVFRRSPETTSIRRLSTVFPEGSGIPLSVFHC